MRSLLFGVVQGVVTHQMVAAFARGDFVNAALLVVAWGVCGWLFFDLVVWGRR